MVHNVWNILSLRLSAFNKYIFYYFYSWNKFHILSEVYTILSYIDLSWKIKKGQQNIGSVCVLICMRNTVMTYHWSFNLLLNGKQPIFMLTRLNGFHPFGSIPRLMIHSGILPVSSLLHQAMLTHALRFVFLDVTLLSQSGSFYHWLPGTLRFQIK